MNKEELLHESLEQRMKGEKGKDWNRKNKNGGESVKEEDGGYPLETKAKEGWIWGMWTGMMDEQQPTPHAAHPSQHSKKWAAGCICKKYESGIFKAIFNKQYF